MNNINEIIYEPDESDDFLESVRDFYMPGFNTSFSDPAKGNLTINQDGSFTYEHTAGTDNDIDEFKYYFTDDDGNSNTATVSIVLDKGLNK